MQIQNNLTPIPKIIHYCWFGKDKNGNRNIKSKMILDCISSWQKFLPDYQIIEWSEDNFDINIHPYTKMAYNNKKWAFVTDYVRLYALKKYGGVYLDTDMYIIKSFDFMDKIISDNDNNNSYFDLILGKEDDKYISAGMIASTKDNMYIDKVMSKYNTLQTSETIPKILTETFEKYQTEIKTQCNVKVFESEYFYPYSSENIKKFKYNINNWTCNAPSVSYGIHLWNYSWGHPLNKFFKKIQLHHHIKVITEKLKIKKLIKKILKME